VLEFEHVLQEGCTEIWCEVHGLEIISKVVFQSQAERKDL
jgi:hypothetical protein